MLTKEQKRKIYERIRKRYKRHARKIGKPKEWKTIEINGKLFKEALGFELLKELELVKKGEESRLRRSNLDDIEGYVPKRRRRKGEDGFLDWLANPCGKGGSHAQECQCNLCMGGFGDPDLVDDRTPEKDEEREARKEFEREYNAELEAKATRNICSRCKSSVCRCEE